MADFLGGVLSQSDLLNSDNAEISEEVELKKKKQRKVCRSLYYVICVVLVCLVCTSCNKRSKYHQKDHDFQNIYPYRKSPYLQHLSS